MITIKEGNILGSKAGYICHQVNCRGAMNSGVAKAIRQEYPEVFTEYFNCAKDVDIGFGDMQLSWKHMFGHIQLVPISKGTINKGYVINMFAQDGYGYNGKRYTSYDAFWNCLNEIKTKVPDGETIAFPYKIGSARGGANWEVIYKMIEEVFKDTNINVEIWRYDDGEKLPRV